MSYQPKLPLLYALHFPPCLYSTLGTTTGALESPALPLTSVTWFTHSSLSDLCSNATFSVKSSLITLSKTITPSFLFSVFPPIIFHTTSICVLLTVCLFPQEYKLHVSRIFFSPVVLFTTESPIPRPGSVLCYVLYKYLHNYWINVYLSKYLTDYKAGPMLFNFCTPISKVHRRVFGAQFMLNTR